MKFLPRYENNLLPTMDNTCIDNFGLKQDVCFEVSEIVSFIYPSIGIESRLLCFFYPGFVKSYI